MWAAFELMYNTYIDGAELYLEDMLPALDNFIAFGAQQLAASPAYVASLVDMVTRMFNEELSNVDLMSACKLAETEMLYLRGLLDKYVPQFVHLAMAQLRNGNVKTNVLKIHLIETVVNAIYYNPAIALDALEKDGWCADFFALWMSMIDKFTRVHDKKLCVLAIAALLSLAPEQVPQSAAQGYEKLLIVSCHASSAWMGANFGL